MTYAAALIDLYTNGPLWAQMAFALIGLLCLTGPVLVAVGLVIEVRQPTRYIRQVRRRNRR